MKTILLTGGTGFLGSHLAKAFKKKYRVIILKRSFSDTFRIKNILDSVHCYDIDRESLGKIFKENTIDIVVHTATNYGRKNISIDDLLQANLYFPIQILKNCLSNNVKMFINTDTVLHKEFNEYALSKKQFLEWLKRCTNSIQIINFKLEHFYGPMDDSSKFVSRMIYKMLKNKDVDLTEGNQKRDFFYIDDLVKAYEIILTSKIQSSYLEVELGSGICISIRKLIERIKVISKSKSLLNFGVVPYRKDEIMESTANISKILKLGWKPTINLEEGLRRTVEYERTRLCHAQKN